MGALSKKGAAERLVRGRLGCECPDSVFAHFQIQVLAAGPAPMVQLIMGGKLLVWIMNAGDASRPADTVPEILRMGLLERDRRGLNRFRLVVAGKIAPESADAFARTAESLDPKVHFHTLDTLDGP
jgi:hypothetical protein